MKVAQRARTDAAIDYALSSGDSDCLEFVCSLPIAKKIVTRMVNHEWSMKQILTCANHEEWADDLFRSIQESVPSHSARWYELVDAVSSLEGEIPLHFSYDVLRNVLQDPLARAFLIKKYGEGERTGQADENVWCLIIRDRIAKCDFTRAYDETKKLVRYPRGFNRHAGGHRVSEVTFHALVGELYEAMAKRELMPSNPTENAFAKQFWPENARWQSTAPDVFVFLDYEAKTSKANPVLAMWYLMRRWRADKKRVRR